jgi:predicted nucleotidyltransferase
MDLSRHTSLVPLAEAIQEVQRAAAVAGVHIYVAGALARDLWMAFGHGLDTGRRASDVDFAVQCRDWVEFERLRQVLFESASSNRAGLCTTSGIGMEPIWISFPTAVSSGPTVRLPGHPQEISS